MKWLKLITILISLSVAASSAIANTLRIGDQKQQLKILLTAAGVLENVPYKLEFAEFPAASPVGEALNAGAIDLGLLGDGSFIFAAGAGRKLKAVSATVTTGKQGSAIIVAEHSAIQSVADLKGRKIATTRGSIGHYLALVALHSVGLRSSDVQFIFLLPTDGRTLLQNGHVDAWTTWSFYTTVSTSSDNARIIATSDDYNGSGGFVVATESALQNKAELIQDFINRLYEAKRWDQQNPEAHALAQSKVTGLPYEVHLDLELHGDKRLVPIDDKVIANLQQVAAIYYEEKLLRRNVDVSNSFDTRFTGQKNHQ